MARLNKPSFKWKKGSPPEFVGSMYQASLLLKTLYFVLTSADNRIQRVNEFPKMQFSRILLDQVDDN